MDRPILLTVIVANWNGKHYLEECLDSIRNQRFRDFQALLVDNASSDHSVEFVEQNYPEVRILRLPGNRGLCHAYNKGVEAADTTRGHIGLLNNDTVLDPECFSAIMEEFEENPDTAFCATKLMEYTNRQCIQSAGDDFLRGGLGIQRGAGQADADEFRHRRKTFGACTAAAFFRRDFFDIVGMGDEKLWLFLSDVDLSFRAQLFGLTGIYVPGAVVYHHGMAPDYQPSPRDIFEGNRDALRVCLKNYPFPLALRNVLHISKLFLVSLYLTPHRMEAIKGRLSILLQFPEILRFRKEIQRKRSVSCQELQSMMS